MGHSITYRLPGLEWSAFYRLTVRGIGPQSIDAVQVDLTGTLRVLNHTDSTFSNAVISLVGMDPAMLPPPKPFGLLDLNPDSALSDLWLSFQGPSPLLPSVYPLRAPASLPSRGGTDLLFARVVRKPAHIVHVCDSDAIPAPSPPNGLPLIRVLHIDNTSANGLGFPLPPGKADLFLGSPRGAPVLSGHAVHTPFPGTLRLDMGKIDGVRAIRREEASDPLPEGGRQSDHSIRLINDLNSPVVVEVVEKPDVPGQWNLIRSSIPCTESSHSLRFSLTLRARSRQTVTYRLRQHAPHGSRGDSVPRQ